MMKISDTLCTGCGTCSIVCPTQCIQMIEDKIGQLVPNVDLNKCVKCNACKETCPQNKILEFHYPMLCYAAWSKNKSDYTYSASGGVAAIFSRYQLKQGGAIFGCDYDEHGDLKYFRLKNMQDVGRIQSSKYSQSNAFECFSEIKTLVDANCSVVFIGTPCQVAGLKSFLGKKASFLVTVDLVCHGTPPNKYLKQYLFELKAKEPYQKIRFRGEFDQMLTVWKDDKVVHQKDWKQDVYFAAFYDNMISYDSCYFCKYAQANRISDITIGDFWGIGELNKISRMSERPSLILVNTEKGKQFFDKVSEDLIYEQRDVEEGIRGNGRLNRPPEKNIQANLFQKVYQMRMFGFKKSVKLSRVIYNLYLKYNVIRRRLSYAKSKLF